MVGMRLDGWSVPLWLVVTGMLLALLTATAASAWPARAVARIPVVQALSARPAAPKPAHRSLVAAVVCFGAGFAALALGNNVAKDQGNPPLIVGGIVALVAGIVVISPLALRAVGAAASRFPVAPRLALRDLGRYQTRAGAALAAISLGLSLSIAIVVIASANEAAAGAGNLSNRQLLVRMQSGSSVLPETSPADVDHLDGDVARLASSLGHATVLPLDVAVDRKEREVGSDGTAVHPMGMLAVQVGSSTFRDAGALYVATPATLKALGIRSGTVAASVELVTPRQGDVYIANVRTADRAPVPASATQHVHAPRYSGMPQHLLTPRALEKYGLTASRAAWFVEAAKPLTAHQRAAARDFAAGLGLSVESRDTNAGLRSLRTGATVAGIGLALAVLAMTIGLIRSEGGRDLRTLIATGASRATRRAVTAATAGALALAGFVLGVAAAYIALLAGYLHDLTRLGQVPLVSLAIMAIGLPLLAAAGGWLLGGGERDAIARQVLD
jgi:putative ABC transport system permease protein